MKAEYKPKGKAVLMMQALERNLLREFSSGEAARIMDCDKRAVSSLLEAPRRHGFLGLRKESGGLIIRGTPYAESEGYCTTRTMRASKEKRVWQPSADDLRIPKVVPGWRPPVMVPPRGMALSGGGQR